ncbi:glutathione S-transferase [Paraburkholderia sp. BL8N3]|jgi:glutathione S-transferase|nr:glutathione S-transferase family protein [Paraburkholderia sp. BL8N3]TCK36654.1 glutathione S-transferase [Paraburkholderia sp. BL8N3]
MVLVGVFESPFVRRVAITLKLLGLPFEHRALCAVRNFDALCEVNPVGKAPTLITDEGDMLIDSTLIIDYAESLASPGRSLIPVDAMQRRKSLRVTGLALAAAEKTIQTIYEGFFRPEEKRHAPWVERVQAQMDAAFRLIEQDALAADPWFFGRSVTQADVTAAVAWQFAQHILPDTAASRVGAYPALHALSERAKALDAFHSTPIS